jgi:hypothetical protein
MSRASLDSILVQDLKSEVIELKLVNELLQSMNDKLQNTTLKQERKLRSQDRSSSISAATNEYFSSSLNRSSLN